MRSRKKCNKETTGDKTHAHFESTLDVQTKADNAEKNERRAKTGVMSNQNERESARTRETACDLQLSVATRGPDSVLTYRNERSHLGKKLLHAAGYRRYADKIAISCLSHFSSFGSTYSYKEIDKH